MLNSIIPICDYKATCNFIHQLEFRLVQNHKEYCEHNHITSYLVKNIFPWLYQKQA